MARQLTNAEAERYQWILAAASDHAGQWLNSGQPQNLGRSRDELIDIHSRLLPEQQQAVEKMVRGSSVDGQGRPHFGEGLGPIRPSRARALRSGLEAIVADSVAKAAPPPTGQMSDADHYLDAGLRLAYAEEQLPWVAGRTGGGMQYPRLFRSRHPDSQVHAVAARRLVRDLAGRSGLPQRRVMRMLLETPPNHRFDVAAGILSGGRLSGLRNRAEDYAHSVAANDMRTQFGRLGRTAASFGQIGQRWKRTPRLVKALVVVVAIANLQVTLPLLLVARATRAIQRSQRVGLRFSAWRHARGAVRSAEKSLRRELKSPAPVAPPAQQPSGPYAQPRPAQAYPQQRPTQVYTQQAPGPAYAQQGPAYAYPQQQPGPAYPQPGPGQAFPQQQPGPAYPQQQPGPAPVYAQQQPGQAAYPQQPAPVSAQQRPVPMNAQVLPVPGQGQPGQVRGNGQPGYGQPGTGQPGYGQSGPMPVNGPGGRMPVDAQGRPLPPGFAQPGAGQVNAQQGQAPNATVPPNAQQPGVRGPGEDTVRLTPGWAAATTGTVPLDAVSEQATASMAAPPDRPGHQQRGHQQETSPGRHTAAD